MNQTEFMTHFWGAKNMGVEFVYNNWKMDIQNSRLYYNLYNDFNVLLNSFTKKLTKLIQTSLENDQNCAFSNFIKIIHIQINTIIEYMTMYASSIMTISKDMISFIDKNNSSFKNFRDKNPVFESITNLNKCKVELIKEKDYYYSRYVENIRSPQSDEMQISSKKQIQLSLNLKKSELKYKNAIEKYNHALTNYNQFAFNGLITLYDRKKMFIESMKVFIDMFNKDTIKIFKDILEKFESRSSAVEETDCDKMIHEFAIQNATGTEKPKLAKFESCDGISINKFRKNKGIFKKFISKRRDRKGKKSEELCAGEDNNDRHEGETTEKHQVNIDSEGYTIKPKLTSDSDSNEESYTDTSFEESAKNLKFFIRPIKQDECEVEAEEKNEIITAFLKIPLIIPSQRSLFKNVNNEVAVSLNCLNDNKSTEIEKTLSTSNIQDEPNLFNTLKFDFDSVKKQKQNKFETEFEKKFENIPLIDDDNVDNTMLGIYENNETLAQTKYLDEKPKSIPIKMSASCNLSQKSNNNASHSE